MASVVQAAVEAAAPSVKLGQHELSVELPDNEIAIRVDPTRLTQVLTNLLNNAAKYTLPSGHIWLKAQADGDQLLLTIRDNGSGMSQGELALVFGMFSRVPHDGSDDGLGIGLTLAKRLVEMHGGQISAKSEGPGKGSEFRILLPVLTNDDVEESPHPEHPAIGRSRRILIVDDNNDALQALARLVTLIGHEVRTAGDGAQAISIAAEFQPDLILMDLGMPGMDGYAAAKRIRAEAWGETMTIVALTGWGQDDDRRRTREAGFDHHLVKPVERTSLEALFNKVDSNPSLRGD